MDDLTQDLSRSKKLKKNNANMIIIKSVKSSEADEMVDLFADVKWSDETGHQNCHRVWWKRLILRTY